MCCKVILKLAPKGDPNILWAIIVASFKKCTASQRETVEGGKVQSEVENLVYGFNNSYYIIVTLHVKCKD